MTTTTKTVPTVPTAAELKIMSLSQIALLIKKYWVKPYFGAVPYVEAMQQLMSVDSKYGCDDGKTIVLYFLSNAATWRGEVAKAVKAELKTRVNLKNK